MNYELKIKKSKNKGYTIIETMIAVSLFIVIIMTGMGSLLNANLLHQKSQNMRSIIDNLNFIMEDIGRNLRTGYDYHCIVGADTLSNLDAKSGSSCWGVAFQPATGGDKWVYEIVQELRGSVVVFYIRKSTDNGVSWVQLTPDEVVINTTASNFSVLGAEAISINTQQPLVVIRLAGTITFRGVVSPFSLQTSVSQRMVDI